MEKSIISDSRVKGKDISFIRGFFIVIGAFVISCTTLFGKPVPFAVSLLCGLSGTECLFALFGAAIGFTVTGSFELTIPYIAAMTLITALRFILASNTSKFMNTALAVAVGVCVGTANYFIANELSDLFIGTVSGLISGVCAYCIGALKSDEDKPLFGIYDNLSARFCTGILLFFICAAFTSFEFGIINIGVFIASLALLYVSDTSIDSGITATAILAAAGIAAGNPEYSSACMLLSLTAPLVAVFTRYGKITRACVFIFTLGAGMVITGISEEAAITAATGTAAAVIYMIIPERYLPLYKNKCSTEISSAPKPFAAFGKKLMNMGNTVEEMKTAIDRTAEVLDRDNPADISWVYGKVSDEVCMSCKNSMVCWGERYNTTADIMNKAVLSLNNGKFVSETALDGLPADCTRKSDIAEELNRKYAVFRSSQSSSRKMSEMRSVLLNQLSATETMLKRMSEELSENETADFRSAAETEKLMREYGLRDTAAIALVIGDRVSIDAYGDGEADINEEEFAEKLSFAIRKEFDLPMITFCDGRTHITISERARFDAEIRVFQKNKSGNAQCGDSYSCFNDGNGNVYMILSDGMGSGSRARIDSAFTCGMLSKLLKAGIDMDSSLEMINTSLMVKSADESFSTLDVCRIDLETGEVLLYKAGSASTFVRCGKKFAEIKGGGIPLGADFEVEYEGKCFCLGAGDIVIMMSDGADVNKEWLGQIVLRDGSNDLAHIIDTLGEALRLSSKRDCDDDITILGVKITK